MKQRDRRWLIWLSIGTSFLASVVGLASVAYWYVVWPIPPQWVLKSSPWLEPKIRAYARAYAKVPFRMDQYERMESEEHVRSTIAQYGRDAFTVFLTCLRSSDQDLRRQSLDLMKALPKQEKFPQDLTNEIIRASIDHDPMIAYLGCVSLLHLPRELSKPAWKAILDRRLDSHYRSRECVLAFLVEKSDRDVIPSIIPDLSDPRASIRSFAIYALQRIGDPSVDEDIRKLTNDPDATVRSDVEFYFRP